jgi:hypothetical protein
MKKQLAIGMLLVMAGIAALGLVTLPASAQTASTGAFATNQTASATGASSSLGSSFSSAGSVAATLNCLTFSGSCSDTG